MASTGKQHCANCIGALSFPISLIYVNELYKHTHTCIKIRTGQQRHWRFLYVLIRFFYVLISFNLLLCNFLNTCNACPVWLYRLGTTDTLVYNVRMYVCNGMDDSFTHYADCAAVNFDFILILINFDFILYYNLYMHLQLNKT